MSKAITKDLTKDMLTSQELAFSRYIANGFSLTQAYIKAFPASEGLKIATIRNKASELMRKNDVVLEVATVVKRQAMLARQAEDRLEEVLTDGDISDKHNKVADVAMFMYEQANGKATQKIEHKGVFVSVSYDLTGSNEQPPKEILQQLNETSSLEDKK